MIIKTPESFMTQIDGFMVNHVVEGPELFLQESYPNSRRNSMIFRLAIFLVTHHH